MILFQLFYTFFKIGLFTFGGGYAMLPLIEEYTIANGWSTKEELLNFIAVSESTPGPFAINMATYIGMEQASLPGAACATLGVVMPSFIVILIVATCYEKFKTNKIVAGCMTGLKPAVIGLIASAIISMATTVFFENGVTAAVFTEIPFYVSIALMVSMAVLAIKKLHPIIIICISAAVGVIAGYALDLPI